MNRHQIQVWGLNVDVKCIGQGQQWDFSAPLDSGNSGPLTEYGVDETHMANMGNFNSLANLASFFNQQTPNFVMPGQDSSSAFEV